LSATQFVNRRSLQVATASGRAPRLPKSCPYSPRFGTEGNGPSPNAAVLHSSALIPTPVWGAVGPRRRPPTRRPGDRVGASTRIWVWPTLIPAAILSGCGPLVPLPSGSQRSRGSAPTHPTCPVHPGRSRVPRLCGSTPPM